MAFHSADEALKFIQDENVEFIDIRFTDVPGTEQHFTIPAHILDADALTDGLAFDGSSIRGFTSIDESDMNLIADLATAQVDPFRAAKTLNIKFFVVDPFTQEPFSRDPRTVALKAEEYLASTRVSLVRRPSFTCLIRCGIPRMRMPGSMRWIRLRAGGIGGRSTSSMGSRIWAIRPG